MPQARSERFVGNVLWSWLGVAANLAIAIVLQPLIIRKLGDVQFGIWVLVLGLIDYYWLLDFGFRAATIKYTAEYRATGEIDKINGILNTGLLYSSVLAGLLIVLTLSFAGSVGQLFQIAPSDRDTFTALVKITGCSLALGIVFNIFGACVEGFQRFDIVNRIWIFTNVLRAVGSLALLSMGYGLIAMSLMVVFTQVVSYGLSLWSLQRVFPERRYARHYATLSVMRHMFRYGANTFISVVSERLVTQGPPVLIGHYKSPAFVGYFGLPSRLLRYTSDLVMRFAMVTGPNASDLAARGEMGAVARLGIFANRYCLTIFMPVVILFLTYGHEIIRVWVGPEFAVNSAPLLPALVAGMSIGFAAQYNSSAILVGLGKHGGWAAGYLVEAVVGVVGLFWVIPAYGIVGAAWLGSILMILNRGILLPILLCRHLAFPLTTYVREIFTRPVAVALPVFVLAELMKMSFLPGQNLMQLVTVGVIVGGTYGVGALFFCLRPEHRATLLVWLAARIKLPLLARLARSASSGQ